MEEQLYWSYGLGEFSGKLLDKSIDTPKEENFFTGLEDSITSKDLQDKKAKEELRANLDKYIFECADITAESYRNLLIQHNSCSLYGDDLYKIFDKINSSLAEGKTEIRIFLQVKRNSILQEYYLYHTDILLRQSSLFYLKSLGYNIDIRLDFSCLKDKYGDNLYILTLDPFNKFDNYGSS